MAIANQVITPEYALYNGDSIQGMMGAPDGCFGFSIYSPPFFGAKNVLSYSSDELDLSNNQDLPTFMHHYGYCVEQIKRCTMPGRMTAVHVADVAVNGKGKLVDFPGEVIRLHEKMGFDYFARYTIWKEPLRVAMRTKALALRHYQLCKDGTQSGNAGADYLLVFRDRRENKVSVAHPLGLSNYAGERPVPPKLLAKYKNWQDPQTNKLAHWIWQQYASSVWDDIRISRVLPYKEARESEEERHPHPLQLDVIERAIVMWSNPGETVGVPFVGVGSEPYGAVRLGRKAIGWELKASYFRQALKNVARALDPAEQESLELDSAEDYFMEVEGRAEVPDPDEE